MSILLWNLVYELHDGDKHYKLYFLYNILVISKTKEVLDFFPPFPLQFSFFYKLILKINHNTIRLNIKCRVNGARSI